MTVREFLDRTGRRDHFDDDFLPSRPAATVVPVPSKYRDQPWVFVWWFLVRLLLFHRISAGRHSGSTLDSRRVPLCVHDYRAFRTVQAPLQTATAVVSTHELVSCGNGGSSYAVVEWIPAATLTQFAQTISFRVCTFFVSCVFRWQGVVLPSYIPGIYTRYIRLV